MNNFPFKIGERIVFVAYDQIYRGIIVDIDLNGIEKLFIRWDYQDRYYFERFPHDAPGLVTEEVYDSPLYKLLQE